MVMCGIVIAFTGVVVQLFTAAMTDWKFDSCNDLISRSGRFDSDSNTYGRYYQSVLFFCNLLSLS